MNWYLMALKKYVEFSGRSRRKEYWYFALFNLIIILILSLLDSYFGWVINSHSAPVTGVAAERSIGVLSGIYYLATILPGLAVSVRRLHDTGRRGWWLLISLIPLIGAIVLLIFMIFDSQPGTNKYGPNPKGENDIMSKPVV